MRSIPIIGQPNSIDKHIHEILLEGKSLVRTVPLPKGNDSIVHEDISPDTIMEYVDEENNNNNKRVCVACYQDRDLNDMGLCSKCARKLQREGRIDLGGGEV